MKLPLLHEKTVWLFACRQFTDGLAQYDRVEGERGHHCTGLYFVHLSMHLSLCLEYLDPE